MGSGASNPEAEQHLKKWETAVNDLQQLCSDQRRAMGLPTRASPGENGSTRPTPNPKARSEGGANEDEKQASFRRRTSSLVSFGSGQRGPVSPQHADGHHQQEAQGGGAKSERTGRAPLVLEEVATHNHRPSEGGLLSPGSEKSRRGGQNEDRFSPQARTQGEPSPQTTRHLNREQIAQIKKSRMEVYKSYQTEDLGGVEGAHPCHHFAVIAAGLSALLGGQLSETDRKKKVTVEDLFFAAQIPLQALHSDHCIMTEIFDVVREFVDVDNRFKEQFIVECCHLDIAPAVGSVEAEGNEVGDRQARVQLPDLRKQLQSEIEEDADSVRFVFFDPYIVQRAMTQDDDEDDEDEEEGQTTDHHLMTSISKQPAGGGHGSKKMHVTAGKGALAALADFRNAVQPMVTLANAAATDRLWTNLEEIPLQHLYKAMHAPMDIGRAGGYIRVTKKGKNDGTTSSDRGGPGGGGDNQSSVHAKDDIDAFFSPELLSGKVLGSKTAGNDAHVTSDRISRHVSACAWALHFLAGASEENHNHGAGLPISIMIRQLQLPIDVFSRCDLTIDQVHVYLRQYLAVSGLDQTLSTQLCPVLTKNSRPDAPPSLSVFEFEAVLISMKAANSDPENPSHLMILQYNANIAHNVINIAKKSQWCVLVGYDEDMQTARVIDANARRYSSSWTVSLEALHKAITNHGYIIVQKKGKGGGRSLGASTTSRDGADSSKSADGSPSLEVGALRHINSTLQARFDLLGAQTVQFPIQDVIQTFVYPQDDMSITQIPVVLRRFGINDVTVESILHRLPFDINALMEPILSLHTMSLLIQTYAGIDSKVGDLRLGVTVKHADRLYNGDKTVLLSDFSEALKEWDSVGGDQMALLINFSHDHIDVFGAAKPCGEYGVVVSYDKETQVVGIADVNPNRFFRVWRVGAQQLYNAMYVPSNTYRSRGFISIRKGGAAPASDGWLSRPCDLAKVPLQNVFSVSPSPQIQALSVAFALLGQPFSPEEIFYEAYLKTLSDQRRRGSQAFAWRDVEVTLNAVNKVTAEVAAKVAKKFLESRKVFTIGIEVVEDTEEEDMEEIFSKDGDAFGEDPEAVYLANYNTEIIHSVSGMGNSMAVLEKYDPESKQIGFFEAEHSQYGLHWTTDMEMLTEACDLGAEGKSDLGIIRVFRKDADQPDKAKIGQGFSAFGGGGGAFGGGGDNNNLDASQPPRSRQTHSPRAVFVGEEQ